MRARRSIAEILPAGEVIEARGDLGTPITGIAYNSRRVDKGDLFFCLPGTRADGHDFAPEAARRGAAGIVVERFLDLEVPVQVRVRNARRALALAADAFFGHPSGRFRLVGITGTNGKTTTSFMLESVLRAAGLRTGLVGTVEYRIAGETMPVTHTTPESLELQELFYLMAQAGVEAAVMEVSSHAVDQHRVAGAAFDALVFTNLSQDHLDYHGDMAAYERAKALLFEERPGIPWVVNACDEAGRRLLASGRALGARLVSYGLADELPDGSGADVVGKVIDAGREGTRVELAAGGDGGAASVRLPLRGRFNALNAVAAAATALTLGVPLESVVRGLEACPQVPGRFEAVEAGQPFLAIVDYAHTPDSLEKVLRSARALLPEGGRLIAVFGCGGDRDRTKRPLMGRAAADIADLVFVTSDNPRSEDPEAIVDDILAGISEQYRDKVKVDVDRRSAIVAAVREARADDIVVVAGKGHETYQIFRDRTVHFDDREEIKAAIEGLGARGDAERGEGDHR